ncbi:MAG: sugar transferase [Acidimicrobiia bacterium]
MTSSVGVVAVPASEESGDLSDSARRAVERRALPRRFGRELAIRILDVVGASLGLLLSSPIWIPAALAVRLSSRGPAFFAQDRYGRDESVFKVVKLRTMVVDQAKVIDLVRVEELEKLGVLTKSDSDPRVTRLGKFLRRTSIDEIPQLWNVLRGEMSLVGPRPLLQFMLDPYPNLRAARCVVKPGVTGLWQISSRDDNTTALSMAAEDLQYIEERSLRTDLGIIARTIPAVVRGSGAV